MAERRSFFRWVLIANTACIATVSDVHHYLESGTVNTWFGGLQPAREHPWAACFNVLLDIGALTGLALTVQKALAARRSERQDGDGPPSP